MAYTPSFNPPINISEVPSVPWKNGGGSTKEIAAFPPNAGIDDFIWRVSVAEIKQSSAYSLFPGVDRTQVLIAGVSLSLQSQIGLYQELLAFQPFSFAGEQDWFAEPEGVCQMLNVMTSRADALSILELTHGAFECVGDGHQRVLMVLQGEYLSEDDSQVYKRGDFMKLDMALGEVFTLSASADAVIISIQFSLLS